ncbi:MULTISPECIES: hypothetical protein [Pantoea]|uniref:hypothetical protein n=1 Tax=Pantoea TaxID=53335 RepID=UPI00049833DC|nr:MULTISPECIES: hypothetical protein [Pantoea]AVG76989.1 hypothetical protein B9Q16_13625 [Pantoea ananatis]MCH9268501.1 hypothetical protein [Pantoea ananatis]MCS4493129.1 hypothetical protein [Pantoea sp. B623]MCV3297917.1 hypothetical protein [Pantoea ananatis]MDC7866407.1 hypothetical protein [Pantoea ananatis]
MQNSRSVACHDLTIAHFQLHGSVITLCCLRVMRFDRSGCSRAYFGSASFSAFTTTLYCSVKLRAFSNSPSVRFSALS